eukprot:scaffold320936_cov41-Tisochrysis_lutea.AAC.1
MSALRRPNPTSVRRCEAGLCASEASPGHVSVLHSHEASWQLEEPDSCPRARAPHRSMSIHRLFTDSSPA